MRKDVEQFRGSFGRLYEGSKSKTLTKQSSLVMDSVDRPVFEAYADAAMLPAIQEEYAVQRPIREWFGKSPAVNNGTIGPHPEFAHLQGTDETELHHITTMFVDIANSTRLSLRYDLEMVRHIKNSILRAASEVVRSMDGHVHRFMGDALMAYFGDRLQTKESSAMAALSCAAMLQVLMTQSVVPDLLRHGIDASDIGFRVGVDFGGDKEVLWSSYGYSVVNEVTATSFFVDASAKLQGMASKDSAMLGHNLLKFLDVPEVMTAIKYKTRAGKQEAVEYLSPNYIRPDGTPNNYRIRELNFGKFAKLLPLPTELKELVVGGVKSHGGITFSAYLLNDGAASVRYPSISACLQKGRSLRFELRAEPGALDGMRLPLTVKFVKQNHGVEATHAVQTTPETIQLDMKPTTDAYRNPRPTVAHIDRDTAYRGLHTVSVELLDARAELAFADVIGVHIA
ncbi:MULTISPECIES: adenylate/guanylate cyclase domain-containing protein [Paraburkholderia]|jgi:adenylate cyclase|uniref:Adenylate cyclase n=1 Tax=Paraburkholderia graminis TaxID=60548 RepID=A0ABD5CR34_9BURK|nr:adenylate/guanylate cyclase domain-containing protein [Paraburkholderia graminis]MDR6207639.1 adenylate cyclase [Paraburkholderia graminis]